MARRVSRSEAEWREQLSPEQYRVLRQRGTEPAFSGELWDEHRPGCYRCAGCGSMLFSSDDKYDGHTGYPTFRAALDPARLEEHEESALFVRRTEVSCRACGSHLGHVFRDGPPPDGLRYSLNSAALDFEKRVEVGQNLAPSPSVSV